MRKILKLWLVFHSNFKFENLVFILKDYLFLHWSVNITIFFKAACKVGSYKQ